ncbi:MAG: hypothetical protein SNJ77_02665 [Cytophagales bacterium]
MKRNEAHNFEFTVKNEGYKDQKFSYSQKTFRGWALIGTIVTWSLLIINGVIPVPIGLVVDLCKGALWKQNINEEGVSKIDYKNFKYTVYCNC